MWKKLLASLRGDAFPGNRMLRSGDLSSIQNTEWFQRKFLNIIPTTFSVNVARQLPAVKSAINAISWRIATLPLKVYDIAADGTPTEVSATDPQSVLVTRQWGEFGNRVEGMQRFLKSVLLYGHGAIYVQRGGEVAQFSGLHPLDPREISRERVNNQIVYRYTADGGALPAIVPRDDLIFLPFEPPQDGVSDESPLLEVWPAVRAALAATMFAAWYFDRGGTPNTVYSSDDGDLEDLRKEQAALWKMEDRMRSRHRRSFIVPPGYKPYKLGGNPEEAQLGNQRTFGVQEIARVYDVPPLVLQDLSRSTYANFTQARHSLGEAIERWAIRVAMEFSNILWPAGTRQVQFDTSLAIRDPFPLRMKGYETGIRNGIMSQNQARVMEGWEASTDPGADELIRSDLASYIFDETEMANAIAEANATVGDDE